MTTTTGDAASGLKSSSSLSGGDLVSRLLAATPPYLYNVPLTPHSFFFSEMLRSFVQAKAESSAAASSSSSAGAAAGSLATSSNRRRKRSWRESRDRPLELTMSTSKERGHNDLKLNFTGDPGDHQEDEIKANNHQIDDRSALNAVTGTDNQSSDHCFVKQSRNFYDDSSRLFGTDRIVRQEAAAAQSILNVIHKSDDNRQNNSQEPVPYVSEHKNNKVDFSARSFIPAEAVESNKITPGFLPTQPMPNPEFLPNPNLWYPPYTPLGQSYSAIDPLHFFIDLRVSGHIWDRKLSDNKQIPSATLKSKHCSAFSVPQTKEYNNRPLNLTRHEVAATSKQPEENFRGTHFILKNLMKTYKDIKTVQVKTNGDINNKEEKQQEQYMIDCQTTVDDSSKEDANSSPSSPAEENGKDIRALIGLELVVDYVKEPKDELSQSPANITDE